MPATPDEMLSAVSGSLAVRTGRSLEQWVALVRSSGERRCLAPRLLMRRERIAQSLPDSRAAEVAAPSDAIHTDFAALVLADWGQASGEGVTEHECHRRRREGRRGFPARCGQAAPGRTAVNGRGR